MGTIKRGILGGVSGKVGTVAGGNWKGINYVRALPEHFTNPKSQKQVFQREKFLYALSFHQPFTEVLRIGFKPYAIKMSGFNAAMSYNLKYAASGEYPDYSIVLANFLVSHGNLTGAFNTQCSATGSGKIKVEWEDNSGTGTAMSGDNAMVVFYNPARNTVTYFMDLATRSDKELVAGLPAVFTGDTIHCFLSFTSLNELVNLATKKSVSDSVYVGEVIVA